MAIVNYLRNWNLLRDTHSNYLSSGGNADAQLLPFNLVTFFRPHCHFLSRVYDNVLVQFQMENFNLLFAKLLTEDT